MVTPADVAGHLAAVLSPHALRLVVAAITEDLHRAAEAHRNGLPAPDRAAVFALLRAVEHTANPGRSWTRSRCAASTSWT